MSSKPVASELDIACILYIHGTFFLTKSTDVSGILKDPLSINCSISGNKLSIFPDFFFLLINISKEKLIEKRSGSVNYKLKGLAHISKFIPNPATTKQDVQIWLKKINKSTCNFSIKIYVSFAILFRNVVSTISCHCLGRNTSFVETSLSIFSNIPGKKKLMFLYWYDKYPLLSNDL